MVTLPNQLRIIIPAQFSKSRELPARAHPTLGNAKSEDRILILNMSGELDQAQLDRVLAKQAKIALNFSTADEHPEDALLGAWSSTLPGTVNLLWSDLFSAAERAGGGGTFNKVLAVARRVTKAKTATQEQIETLSSYLESFDFADRISSANADRLAEILQLVYAGYYAGILNQEEARGHKAAIQRATTALFKADPLA